MAGKPVLLAERRLLVVLGATCRTGNRDSLTAKPIAGAGLAGGLPHVWTPGSLDAGQRVS
jgi:hypothetical protein